MIRRPACHERLDYLARRALYRRHAPGHGATVREIVRVVAEDRMLAFAPMPLLHADLVRALPTADVGNVAEHWRGGGSR